MSSRMYKPRGSPRSSRGSRRQTVNRYRAASRGSMYSSIRRTGRSLGKARSLGLKNARTGGLLGVETKYFDVSFSGTVSNSTDCSGAEIDPATILCLNGVPQGDTASSRDGFKIAMKSIQIEGRFIILRQVLLELMLRRIRLLQTVPRLSMLPLFLTLKRTLRSSTLRMFMSILSVLPLAVPVLFET